MGSLHLYSPDAGISREAQSHTQVAEVYRLLGKLSFLYRAASCPFLTTAIFPAAQRPWMGRRREGGALGSVTGLLEGPGDSIGWVLIPI